jgi:tetratricopeptide (TPR) repeat protein
MRGSYRLEATPQATATTPDREYLTAQALMLEAQDLAKQFPKTAQLAIDKLEQALPVWRELGLPFWVALTLNKIGRAHFSLNQHDKAITCYEQSLTINREVKNRRREASDLNNLANAYFGLRQFDKAIERFEQSLVLYRELKDRRREGLILFSLGNTNNSLNQPEKAITYYDQALTILREVKDRSFEAQTVNSMGFVYYNRGQMDKAIASFESAIAMYREVKDQSREVQTLRNVGIAYSRLGRSEKALEMLDQALVFSRELKDRTEEGNTLVALGLTYGGMGQTEKAIDHYQQALEIGDETGNAQVQAEARLGLAQVHLYREEWPEARQLAETPSSRGYRPVLAEVLAVLGTAYLREGDRAKAGEAFSAALSAANTLLADTNGLIDVLYAKGIASAGQAITGNPDMAQAARRTFEQALAAAPAPGLRARALRQLHLLVPADADGVLTDIQRVLAGNHATPSK